MPRVHKISRDFAANPWSRHPFTKTLAHMQPVPKQFVPDKASIKLMRLDPFAKVKDRIKYWNFMPGDRVRVRGSKDQRMMEVAQVNKLTNHVRLREIPDEEAEEKINTTEPIEDLLKVHYSRLQLYWRHETLPGKEEPEPIFVTRIARGGIKWKPEGGSQGSYMYWRRYPLATSPPLPKEQIRKVEIPWPTVEVDRLEKQAQIGYVMEKYITKPETVTALTYTPPGKPVIMHASSPRWMHQYLRTLYNPGYDRAENGPYEISLQRELSNPYSRAKRQARWQARHKYRKLLLSQIMKEELKNLDGRTRREARAEAVFRWKAQLVREEQADHRRRKAKRGDFARETRKRMRRRAKEQERAEILRKLVLQEGPNQVIPGSRAPASTA